MAIGTTFITTNLKSTRTVIIDIPIHHLAISCSFEYHTHDAKQIKILYSTNN